MRVKFKVYDDFDAPGYSLTDYAEKWMLPYGLGEMAVDDTRDFSGGYLSLSAVPFQTTSDVGVNDHLKYMAVSSRTFPVPESGTLCSRRTSGPPPWAHVTNIGIPVDRQGAAFTGTYQP